VKKQRIKDKANSEVAEIRLYMENKAEACRENYVRVTLHIGVCNCTIGVCNCTTHSNIQSFQTLQRESNM